MWPTSSAFQEALLEPHRVIAIADLWLGGTPLLRELPVAGGTIRIQPGLQRRTADLDLVETHTPALNAVLNALSVPGVQVRTRRGIQFLDGSTELVPTGVFNVRRIRESKGRIQLTLADHGRRVARARFRSPRTSSTGYTLPQQIQLFAAEVIPNLRTVNVSGNGTRVPRMVWEQNRDDAITQLSAAAACEVGFDPDGALRLARPKPISVPADWTLHSGKALVQAARDVDWDTVFNVVVAVGERADGTVAAFGVAEDDDPASATYVDGPLGEQVTFSTSALYLTNTQARNAAAAILDRSKGARQQIDLEAVCNPALDYGDRVDLADVKAGMYGRHLVDSGTFTWRGTGMSLQTRAIGGAA